jgi:transposase
MLMTNDPPQLQYELRETFNALRWILHAGAPWRLLPTAQEESFHHRIAPTTCAFHSDSPRRISTGCACSA